MDESLQPFVLAKGFVAFSGTLIDSLVVLFSSVVLITSAAVLSA